MRLIQAWSSQNKNIIILDRKWSFYTTHSDVTWQTPPPELILFMSEMKTSGYLLYKEEFHLYRWQMQQWGMIFNLIFQKKYF